MAINQLSSVQCIASIINSNAINAFAYLRQAWLNLNEKDQDANDSLLDLAQESTGSSYNTVQACLNDFLGYTDIHTLTVVEALNMIVLDGGFLPFKEGSLGFWQLDPNTGLMEDKSDFDTDLQWKYPVYKGLGTSDSHIQFKDSSDNNFEWDDDEEIEFSFYTRFNESISGTYEDLVQLAENTATDPKITVEIVDGTTFGGGDRNEIWVEQYDGSTTESIKYTFTADDELHKIGVIFYRTTNKFY